jgi:hypothetical protein
MTEKRQTSQGYIVRILQHFATKLRNITNFVMSFQVDLSRSKFCSLGNRSIAKDTAQPDPETRLFQTINNLVKIRRVVRCFNLEQLRVALNQHINHSRILILRFFES